MTYKNYYIDFDTPSTVPENIKKVIQDFTGSDSYSKMLDGQAYYMQHNTCIAQREMKYWKANSTADGKGVNGCLVNDPYKANNKMYSGFTRILVDQTIQYLLGQEPTWNEEADEVITEENNIDGKRLSNARFNSGIEAQNKSRGWIYVYVSNGSLSFKAIPSEQIIPIYSIDGELTSIIRFYTKDVLNAKGEIESASVVEVHDSEKVTYYIKFNSEANYKPWCCYNGVNERYHIVEKTTLGKKLKGIKNQGFGRPPFVFTEFKDNGFTVLEAIKSYQDIFDVVKSDWSNNFEDTKDMVDIVKGYSGTDLATFQDRLKKYGVVKLDENTSYDRQTTEVPYQARSLFLKETNDDIYKWGEGVDTMRDYSGTITNMAVGTRYTALDTKANWFGKNINTMHEQLRYFINVWLKRQGTKELENLSVTYNKSLLMNENENVKTNAEAMGTVSEQTRLTNHPWVTDVEAEMKLMKTERDGMFIEEVPPVEV